MLDGGVWDEVVSGDMMGGEGEGMERGERHCCCFGHESGRVDGVNGRG
jgi:hypothetical protein